MGSYLVHLYVTNFSYCSEQYLTRNNLKKDRVYLESQLEEIPSIMVGSAWQGKQLVAGAAETLS